MQNLTVTRTTPTMSSQDIADLVDSRHDKVKQSIERLAERGVISLPPVGIVKVKRERREETVSVYNLCKRDSYVVVAQLSPEFTARLVDRWQELEEQQEPPTLPLLPAIPTSFAEALRLAADLSEQNAALEVERDAAIATKALIGSKREATAMATASAAIRKAQRLEVELDKSLEYSTVKRMEAIYAQKFPWKPLKVLSLEIGAPIERVPDANYTEVNSYRADVWYRVYNVSIATPAITA